MSTAHPDTLPEPVDVARSILAESMTPLDRQAFDEARVAFGEAYAHALPALAYRDGQAHDEALVEGLEACVVTYLREAAKR